MVGLHPLGTALLLLWLALDAPPERPAVEPAIPVVRRVLLVSVDGLRPDLVLRAETPTMRSLLTDGSFTLWATTIPAAVTLPSHVSMLTGVSVARHGVDWNHDLPPGEQVYPKRPTLFELAKRAGYTTAMAVGKSKLVALARPGTVDRVFLPAVTVGDSTVADSAARWIEAFRPQVLFVHLPGVDRAGHRHGWGSRAQLEAVETADRCIARLLRALREQGLLDSTVVLVTADHGGSGSSHGADDRHSRHIPWIAVGPGIRDNVDLSSLMPGRGRTVRTEDTFATLCHLLGLTPSLPVDGRPVTEMLEEGAAARR